MCVRSKDRRLVESIGLAGAVLIISHQLLTASRVRPAARPDGLVQQNAVDCYQLTTTHVASSVQLLTAGKRALSVSRYCVV